MKKEDLIKAAYNAVAEIWFCYPEYMEKAEMTEKECEILFIRGALWMANQLGADPYGLEKK